MDNFLYSQIERTDTNKAALNTIKSFVSRAQLQSYLIKKPLGEAKYEYNYEDVIVLLIPGYKIMFINLGNPDDENFKYFCEDFIEDLGYISDKYDYKEVIGRPRDWKRNQQVTIDYVSMNEAEFLEEITNCKIIDPTQKRISELLISLLIGSINSIDKVGINEPQSLLDKVKQKIVLFDSDQTRFIFEKIEKDRITIQGLAGTGKTELLLHKLKELYLSPSKPKIAFTCHNKTLANNLKRRIPEFFTFMRVDEQIQWNERLWVYHSWGSEHSPDSGMYSYICNFYNIPFQRYSSSNSFKKVCTDALMYLNQLGEISKCFDYILIDESQDFPEEFFILCEKISSGSVYVAGDIFQNIFDNDLSGVSPDFLLNKCYRTDPRTLMFAHSVGLALFERPVVTWLEDSEWEACGYRIEKEDDIYNLTREKIRRFEDIEKLDEIRPLDIREMDSKQEILSGIVSVITEIKGKNPTVTPNDIGIVFIDDSKTIYNMIDTLEIMIANQFHWGVNKGYENKGIVENRIFISNKNNVKGLEFPFLICVVTNQIEKNVKARNTLYMTLTRSFITSYLIMSSINSSIIKTWNEGLTYILGTNILRIKKPLPNEIMSSEQLRIEEAAYRTRQEIIEDLFVEYGIPEDKQDRMIKIIDAFSEDRDSDLTEPLIRQIIERNKRIL